jgi:hypothetical protein
MRFKKKWEKTYLIFEMEIDFDKKKKLTNLPILELPKTYLDVYS